MRRKTPLKNRLQYRISYLRIQPVAKRNRFGAAMAKLIRWNLTTLDPAA
jgi:hypothetical protein